MSEKEMRKMDFSIAEQVMGWIRGERWGNGNGEWVIDGKGYSHHRMSFDQTPHYTTDPAAAMSVLEKCAMIAHKGCKQVAIRPHGSAWVISARDKYEDKIVEAKTLPLAICLFAQKLHETKT